MARTPEEKAERKKRRPDDLTRALRTGTTTVDSTHIWPTFTAYIEHGLDAFDRDPEALIMAGADGDMEWTVDVYMPGGITPVVVSPRVFLAALMWRGDCAFNRHFVEKTWESVR